MGWQQARHKESGNSLRVFQIPVDQYDFPPGIDVRMNEDDFEHRYIHFQDGLLSVNRGEWLIIDDLGALEVFQDISDTIEVIPPPPPPPPFNILLAGTDTPLMKINGAFQIGTLKGSVMIFQQGEGLPVHVHPDDRNHVTIVAKGRFQCTGRPAIEGQIIESGEMADWVPGEPHGFIALDPGENIMWQIRKTT